MVTDYTEPDFSTSALLTIDTQNDFSLPGAVAEIAGTADIIPKMQELVEIYRDKGLPIIHVVRLYLADGSNVDLCRRSTVEGGLQIVHPGTDGAELADALKPSSEERVDAERLLQGALQRVGTGEWIMYKPRWGAFYQTPLEAHLKRLGVTTLVVTGCNFPNCPRTTVYEASERDYRVVLVSDAVSGLYDRGRAELEGIGVRLRTVGEVLQCLANA